MRLIITADAEDATAVLAMMLDKTPLFEGRERLGWGWVFRANGKEFFVAQIKGGLSARPANRKAPK